VVIAITACSRKDQRPALVLASERVARRKNTGREREKIRRANLRFDERTSRGGGKVRETSHNCKVANFHVREVRIVLLSDLMRERHVKLSCVWSFAVIVSELPATHCKIFGRVTFRLSHSLVHFVKSCRIPISLDWIETLYCDVCVFSVYFRHFVK